MTQPELLPPLPRTGDERAMLRSFLDYFRSVLLRKVDGLTTEQSQATIKPSALHLHGLIRHMAFVEHYWFAQIFAGDDEPFYWDDPTDEDRDFHPLPSDLLEADLQLLVTEIERSRLTEASAASAEQIATKQRAGEAVSLRWIMLHMVEEYARHCGHADFLREAIDGATGD
jgi:integrase